MLHDHVLGNVYTYDNSYIHNANLAVTHWSMLDKDNKLDVEFDLFPKSLLQQNQIKLMVIAKAKCKGKSLPLLDERAAFIYMMVYLLYLSTWEPIGDPPIHMCY